jgi:hypothetical protein
MTLKRTHPEIEVEPQTVEELRRKVAWQVSIAYGLPLEDVHVPEVQLVEVDPEPLPLPLPEPEPELPPAALVPGPFVLPTLTELERLVADAGDANPARAEEWRWYLFYLRDFAQADGTLDDTFTLLVETAFGELLQAEPRVH